MPILANAKKALRSSLKKQAINQVVRARTRTTLKQAQLKPTADSLSAAFSAVDKAVKRNLVHANKAARLKSQLSKLVASK